MQLRKCQINQATEHFFIRRRFRFRISDRIPVIVTSLSGLPPLQCHHGAFKHATMTSAFFLIHVTINNPGFRCYIASAFHEAYLSNTCSYGQRTVLCAVQISHRCMINIRCTAAYFLSQNSQVYTKDAFLTHEIASS